MRTYRRGGVVSVSKTVEVDVEVDLQDLIENIGTDNDLIAKLGLTKAVTIRPLQETWECIARAVRTDSRRELVDLLSTLAWDQAGVVIRPVV